MLLVSILDVSLNTLLLLSCCNFPKLAIAPVTEDPYVEMFVDPILLDCEYSESSKIGNTDISKYGSTVTGAVKNLGDWRTWKLKYSGKGSHTETMPDGWSEAIIIMPFDSGNSKAEYYCFKGMTSGLYQETTLDNLNTSYSGYSYNKWMYDGNNRISLVESYYRNNSQISSQTSYIYYR